MGSHHSNENWDYVGEPTWIRHRAFAIKDCPFEESDNLCPICQSQLFVAETSKIDDAKSILTGIIGSIKEEEEERQNLKSERIKSLTSKKGLLDDMTIVINGEDYSHLPWMSEDELNSISHVKREDLPHPFCMTNEEIIEEAVSWCTDAIVSKTKSLWRYFYKEEQEQYRDYKHEYHYNQRGPRLYNEISIQFYNSEFYKSNPPEVLVGYPTYPKNLPYERRMNQIDLCERIRKELYYDIKEKIELKNTQRIESEKGMLIDYSYKLVTFAKRRNSNTVSNKILSEFIEEEDLELVWKDSKDVLRIRSNLMLKGLR